MDSFWARLYDKDKDCRNGALLATAFVVVLIMSLIVLLIIHVLGVVFGALDPQYRRLAWLLTGLLAGFLVVVWPWWSIRRSRSRQPTRLRHRPLSQDELRVARAKLLKGGDPTRL